MNEIRLEREFNTIYMPQSTRLKILLRLGCCFAILLLSGRMAAAEGATNSVLVPKELMGPQTAWGEETNGVRAGINWELSDKMIVRIFVLTSRTNTAWNYVAPPGKIFMRFELRDARGMIQTPLKGKKMDVELPMRILTKEMPHSPAVGHEAGMIENRLLVTAGSPVIFRDVIIQNVYRIEQEGDYALTVCVAIYEFAPDRQSVSRIDLPCVKAKLHLKE